MSDTAIQVKGLSKQYCIGDQQEQYRTIREAVVETVKAPFRRALSLLRGHAYGAAEMDETIWALRDVSFEVEHGEVLGIIGPNGAGKTTLLKILSRITEPTEGRAVLLGHVGSLLEVGTGFHPELSGRENVYLNGAILGMRRDEIDSKFGEIVEFSGVERFIDTPVKHYSSGMRVRLAFSVAAHLDPEILLIDEVLAVGDAAFQKKCLGKMKDVAEEGRTVLFVSHDLTAIEALTNRCLLFGSGRLLVDDDTSSTVSHYLRSVSGQRETSVEDWSDRLGSGEASVVRFLTLSQSGKEKEFFRPGEPIRVLVGVEFSEPLVADVGVVVESDMGKALFASHLSDNHELQEWSNYHEFVVDISPNHLRHGNYLVSLAVFAEDMRQFYDVVNHFPAFEIEGRSIACEVPTDSRWGDLYFSLSWEVR